MAAIVVEVPCSGSIHRVELRGDCTVAMLDHSEAVVRAFVAFNAEPPECLAVVDKARNEPIRFIFDNVEMTDKVKGLLACDFAAHVLPIFEASYPDDDRPRKAIVVTRAYWRDNATVEQFDAAWAAAAAAAASSSWAAWDAADAAGAVDAAWAASAARYAARAAREAGDEAQYAAWAARYAAAAAWRAAAWRAASAVYHQAKDQGVDDQAAEAAKAAERQWQLGRTVKVLDAVQRGKRWPRLS